MINIKKEDLILTYMYYAYSQSAGENVNDMFSKEQFERCTNTQAELNKIVSHYKSLEGTEQEKFGDEMDEFFINAVKGL